jgi:5-methylcytosine-specific restriction enzyme A
MTPWAPKKPCTAPGCSRLCDGGKCPEHLGIERRIYDQGRRSPEAHRFYRSKQWLAVRQAHLRHEPLCRACKAAGRIVPGYAVDHIVPIADGGARLDEANLQSLCAACHSRKSLGERPVGGT